MRQDLSARPLSQSLGSSYHAMLLSGRYVHIFLQRLLIIIIFVIIFEYGISQRNLKLRYSNTHHEVRSSIKTNVTTSQIITVCQHCPSAMGGIPEIKHSHLQMRSLQPRNMIEFSCFSQ